MINTDSLRHLDIALLLIEGVKESANINVRASQPIPPEHSHESMLRRCIVARQELLNFQKGLKSW